MTQLLIMGATILAQEPFTVTEDEITIHATDLPKEIAEGVTVILDVLIYPKHVMPGWQIVDVTLPDGFTPYGYSWDGSALVQSQASIDEAEANRIAVLKEQISEIEDAHPITPRQHRELALIMRQVILFVSPDHPPVHGLEVANDIDAQIVALRVQL